MSFYKYRFESSDLEITCETRWDTKQATDLTKEIFNLWCHSMLRVEGPNSQERLKAHLSRRTEGQSPAEVYELTFLQENRNDSTRVRAKFIIRAHFGDDAAAIADRERRLVRHLNANGADLFSTDLQEPIDSVPHVVVYRHGDDQLNENSKLLRDALIDVLTSKNVRDVENFAEIICRLGRTVIEKYEQFGPNHKLTFGERYFERIRGRLAPDLVIDAFDRSVTVENGLLKVPTEDDETPQSIGNVEGILTAELLEALSTGDSASVPRKWVRLDAYALRPAIRDDGYLRFQSGDTQIWIHIDPKSFAGVVNKDQRYGLIFKCEANLVLTGTGQLQKLDFTDDACLSTQDFGELCRSLKERIEEGVRHTDLHSRNILFAQSGMKVIDLSSMDDDLLGVSQARLEISIWDEVTKRLALDIEDAEKILQSLADNTELSEQDVAWEAWALHTILRNLRRGMSEGMTIPIHDLELQIALAYATQVLLHQRYHLEHGGLDGSDEREAHRVSKAFNAVCRYWLKQFQQLVTGEFGTRASEQLPIVKSPAQTEEFLMFNGQPAQLMEPAQSVEPADLIAALDQPTIYSLWNKALSSRSLPIVEARAAEFLEAIVQQNSRFMLAPLTDLQERIWEQADAVKPFQSDLHVLVAAPTSSGKSTVAEMFLAGPPLLNHERRCALYIAPTRALTQAKYRELKQFFAGDAEMSREGGIVLSTGEDADEDWYINHGRFSIACMVYEKANILFSQNRKLLARLGCVVIDEMHMLTDLERGPVLEMVLTKLLHERYSVDAQQHRYVGQETVRIIAISTEDQPDAAMEKFLSVRDPDTGRALKPLTFHEPRRPVSVEHVLILPGQQDEPYVQFPIIKFASTQHRTLSSTAIGLLNKRLLAEARKVAPRNLTRNIETKNEMKTRLNALLLDLLADNPRGYRVLVFVPGRREAEQEAKRLKNKLTKRSKGTRVEQLGARFRHEEISRRLKPHLDAAEDQRMAEEVRQCAEAGILVHHSDIDKKIRLEIESICSTISSETPSQVVFATETLSYGINLAVHDVILLGTDFHTQTRLREHQIQRLSTCAFHNMAGRAGRLGKIGGMEAHVYIIAPYDHGDAFKIIKDFYMSIDPVKSQIYVRDDRNVQLDAEDNPFLIVDKSDDPCAKYATLGALDFSYPYVRSVLDALRHLNTSDSETKTPVDYESLRALFVRTLYSGQCLMLENPRERELFGCALRRILDDCAKPALHLVEVDASDPKRKFYTITARGEAIIDTGTEVHTVEPLLKMVRQIHAVWRDLHGDQPFPTDLYVLCLIAQHEVFRQYIRYTPECKGGDDQKDWPRAIATSNRAAVFEAFSEAVSKTEAFSSEEAKTLAGALRGVLDAWDPIRKIPSGYLNGASDSLLRFFNGIIAWINGEERAVVDKLIEGHELPEAYRARMESFRRFTELLNTKTLFLSKMLATDKTGDLLFQPDDERNMHQLASRLRLGCTAQAIPLFWPFSSDFRRREAVKLLNANITPSRLLSVAEPEKLVENSVEIVPHKLDNLRQDLEKYAKKEFAELQEEWTGVPAPDAKREAIHRLWKDLNKRFAESVVTYRQSKEEHVHFDTLLRDCLDFSQLQFDSDELITTTLGPSSRSTLDERYRVRVALPETGVGMLWHGERPLFVSHGDKEAEERANTRDRKKWEKQHQVKVMGVQLRKGWICHSGQGNWQPLANLLQDEHKNRHLVIVSLPWTPLRDEMPNDLVDVLMRRASLPEFSTIIMTPAAFAIMVSSIVRNFLPSEACMKMLIEAPSTNHLFRALTVSSIQRMLDETPDRQVPPTIREKLIRHFEVTT